MPRSPTRVHCTVLPNFLNNVIAPECAAKRIPKDRSEEHGGGPLLWKDTCKLPSKPITAYSRTIVFGSRTIFLFSTEINPNLDSPICRMQRGRGLDAACGLGSGGR